MASAALALALLVSPPSLGQPNETVEGTGQVHGPWCRKALRLVLDNGRQFEIDPRFASLRGTPVDVRDGVVSKTGCGMALTLSANIVTATPRSTIELTFNSTEWATRAREIDALSRRFPDSRFHLRVTGNSAAVDAARIGLHIAKVQPTLLQRTVIEPAVGASGWRVRYGKSNDHATSVEDVDRLLAARR